MVDPVDRPAYRERLLPQWWAWLIAYALVGMVAVAYGGALGTRPGVLVGVGGTVLATWLIWITSPVVSVDSRGLGAASAQLPLSFIADARAVTRDEIRVLRRPRSDARLFDVLRPWAARAAVLVELEDPEDPHPAWLVSSRRPQRLVDALIA